jgi:mono/diheme cytochrome c family protein
MGPLNEGLIHLGYYRPEIFVVRLNERGTNSQAAVLSVTRQLEFPPLSGMVNPADGQLYVIGFQIWGTEAKLVSGLARLRYTGAPNHLPREVAAMKEGVLLRFDVPLDPRPATSPENFSADRWNYRRTASYGSPHFRLDESKGQDSLRPASTYLSKDRHSVFIGVPDMRPAMQMRIGWALATADGTTFEQNAYLTPRELTAFDPVREGFASLQVNLQPGNTPAPAKSPAPVTIEEGRRVAELMGCVACHSDDGTTEGKTGPTWKGLFGSRRDFADGRKAIADEAYLRESIREPTARVVNGFEANTGMPSYDGVITDAQIEALVLYLKSLR